MAKVKNFRVDVDELHPGDNVFLGDRKMNVLNVNRESRRVLISGRKQNCKNCDIRWIAEHRLGTRPRSISRRKIRTLDSVPGDVMDGIHWVPIKIPEPTTAPPGSSGKLEVLRERVDRGEQLWHVDDSDCSTWLGIFPSRPVRRESASWVRASVRASVDRALNQGLNDNR